VTQPELQSTAWQTSWPEGRANLNSLGRTVQDSEVSKSSGQGLTPLSRQRTATPVAAASAVAAALQQLHSDTGTGNDSESEASMAAAMMTQRPGWPRPNHWRLQQALMDQ
jgi:hypothetical protein